MTDFRDPLWYREEAARLRVKAVAVVDSKELRDSYLALSLEYERLAVVLDHAKLLSGAKEREPRVAMARCRGGHLKCSPMAEGQSTVEEYSPPDCRRVCRALSSSSIGNRSRAAILRRLARETRDQAARERLLLLAARF